MRGHMKKCIRKAAAAVLSAALLVTSESPAFAQNIQQTAVPADVITEQSRLEDGIAQTGYISDSFSEKRHLRMFRRNLHIRPITYLALLFRKEANASSLFFCPLVTLDQYGSICRDTFFTTGKS